MSIYLECWHLKRPCNVNKSSICLQVVFTLKLNMNSICAGLPQNSSFCPNRMTVRMKFTLLHVQSRSAKAEMLWLGRQASNLYLRWWKYEHKHVKTEEQLITRSHRQCLHPLRFINMSKAKGGGFPTHARVHTVQHIDCTSIQHISYHIQKGFCWPCRIHSVQLFKQPSVSLIKMSRPSETRV